MVLMGEDSHGLETQRQRNRASALTWVAGMGEREGREVAGTSAAFSFLHLGQTHLAMGALDGVPAVPSVYKERGGVAGRKRE